MLNSVFSWEGHLRNAVACAYKNLAQLKQFFRQFIPQKSCQNLRNQLVQSLVISKLQWCIGLMFPLQCNMISLIKRLLRVAASAILFRHACSDCLIKIGWLLPQKWCFLNAFAVIIRQRSHDLLLYSSSRKKCLLKCHI